jgi:hypothetical protein
VIVVTAKDLTQEDRERLNGGGGRVLRKGLDSGRQLVDEVQRLLGRAPRPQARVSGRSLSPFTLSMAEV